MNIELQSYTLRSGGSMIPTGPGMKSHDVTHWQLGHEEVTRLVLVAPGTVVVTYRDGTEDVVCAHGMGRRTKADAAQQQGGKRP